MSLPPRSRNSDVARLLEEIGDLLEIKGDQSFRVNAYRSAARRIEGLREPIELVHAEKRLRKIQGIGPALEQKIGEYLDTGRLGYIEKLRAELPDRRRRAADRAGPRAADRPPDLRPAWRRQPGRARGRRPGQSPARRRRPGRPDRGAHPGRARAAEAALAGAIRSG